MEFLLTFLINTAWVVVGVLAVLLGWRGCQLAFGNRNSNNQPQGCTNCNCAASPEQTQ